jgi:hypothetical protein
MSNTKSAWQVGGQNFATVFAVLVTAFDPATAFVLALVATVVLMAMA